VRVAILVLAGCGRLHFDPFGPSGPGDGGVDAPVIAPGLWAQASAGSGHTCAIDLDGALWCWGLNQGGQLGLGLAAATVPTPTHLGAATWTAIQAGWFHFCGIHSDRSMWCWGNNAGGQDGPNGGSSPVMTPVPLGVGTWSQVATSDINTGAIQPDGSLYVWGDDSAGQLANGNFNSQSAPLQIAGTWTQIATGDVYYCAVRIDHTLWCWGEDSDAQLGDGGAAMEALAPIQLAGTFSQVATSRAATCAIRDDGTLACVGDNTQQELVVGAGSGWDALSAGYDHFCGLHQTNTLSCWGTNANGQLGVTPATPSSATPLDIAVAGETWSSVTLGDTHTCALAQDHNLWCWGDNTSGQLGNSGSSTPVPQLVLHP
jgi:hypothetical protein